MKLYMAPGINNVTGVVALLLWSESELAVPPRLLLSHSCGVPQEEGFNGLGAAPNSICKNQSWSNPGDQQWLKLGSVPFLDKQEAQAPTPALPDTWQPRQEAHIRCWKDYPPHTMPLCPQRGKTHVQSLACLYSRAADYDEMNLGKERATTTATSPWRTLL